jgi:hypothetical protein
MTAAVWSGVSRITSARRPQIVKARYSGEKDNYLNSIFSSLGVYLSGRGVVRQPHIANLSAFLKLKLPAIVQRSPHRADVKPACQVLSSVPGCGTICSTLPGNMDSSPALDAPTTTDAGYVACPSCQRAEAIMCPCSELLWPVGISLTRWDL